MGNFHGCQENLCEHPLKVFQRKFQLRDDIREELMRKSSLAFLAVGTKQTWETAVRGKTSLMIHGGEYVNT